MAGERMQEKTLKLCVLGHNIKYTLSPKVHSALFEFLGERGEYGVCDVSLHELGGAVKKLMSEYDGFNVTKPYKETVADLFGHVGPVNTVCRDGRCTSTDAEGFFGDYEAAFGTPNGRILLLGAGGAAKSVAEALSKIENVQTFVFNRTYEKTKEFSRYGAVAVKSAEGIYDAVINCTSLGLGGEQAAPAELEFGGVKFAYDLIYSPPVTPFLESAAKAGAKTCNGLGMLVRQAIAAHEFWRGENFSSSVKKSMVEFISARIK